MLGLVLFESDKRYKELISQIDLKELLDKIIELHFDNRKFTLKGSLEWIPNTQKQKERHFKKFGKQLKPRRRGYKIREVYWEGKNQEDNGSSHHYIVISNIEDDGVFYLMNDHKAGRMGQNFRYKFQIIDYQKNTDLSNCKVELLNKTMTMIR